MLSETDKRTFQLHTYGFSYLTSFPIMWDKNYTAVELNRSKLSKRVFQINMFLSALALMGCLFDLLYHFLVQPITNYNIGTICLHMGSVTLLALPGFGILLWYRHPETLDGINMILSSMLHRTKERPGKKKLELMDFLLLGITIVVIPSPFLIFFSALYLRLDCFYFIIGIILGDPTYKSLSTFGYIFCLFIRAIPVSCAFESARTASTWAMLIVVVLKWLRHHLNIMLLSKIPNPVRLSIVLRNFKLLSIINNFVSLALQDSLEIAITTLFWGNVIGVYVLIKASHVLPTFMFLLVSCVLFLFACAAIILPTVISQISERSRCVTRNLQTSAALIYARGHLSWTDRELLIMKKESMALVEIVLSYNSFSVIDRKFCMDSLGHLIDRIFDAILIF